MLFIDVTGASSDISRFRKVIGGLLTLVILTLVFAMTMFGTRSSGSAQCSAVVERIAIEMEEIEELSKRMEQRQLFDQFLDAEKEVTAHDTCLVSRVRTIGCERSCTFWSFFVRLAEAISLKFLYMRLVEVSEYGCR